MRWGLLGGTFDPVHLGHLRCAEEVLEIFALDRIIFIPASRPPHKIDACPTSFCHREQMVKLAIEGNPAFSFSDVENRREGKSFSVETIDFFRKSYPENLELYFILGQDAFSQIKTWKNWEKLLMSCDFVVMKRPGCENAGLSGIVSSDFASRFKYDEAEGGLKGPAGSVIYFQEVTLLDISASDIRRRLKERKSIRYLVPDAVRRYIFQNSLYEAGTGLKPASAERSE
ncbi:MAG: nicotinate-nucleotide adenylyltransferase [Syntrophales bacterium]|nr:nicotinate-nucleotide adenylyltransferase [Syntrophales bacterium]